MTDLTLRLYAYNTGRLETRVSAALGGAGGVIDNHDFVNNTDRVVTGYYDIFFNAGHFEDTLTVAFTNFRSMGRLDAVGVGAATLREVLVVPEPPSVLVITVGAMGMRLRRAKPRRPKRRAR